METSLFHGYNIFRRFISSRDRLDILVFADTTGEPISNFLLLGRLARVQAAFWGTPVTSGTHLAWRLDEIRLQPEGVS